jgi:hypothetical protein
VWDHLAVRRWCTTKTNYLLLQGGVHASSLTTLTAIASAFLPCRAALALVIMRVKTPTV